MGLENRHHLAMDAKSSVHGFGVNYLMRDFMGALAYTLLVTLSPKAEELKAFEPMTRAV